MTHPLVITLLGKITATLPSGETTSGTASISGSTRDSAMSAKQMAGMRSELLQLLVRAAQLPPPTQTKGFSCPCYPPRDKSCADCCSYPTMDISIQVQAYPPPPPRNPRLRPRNPALPINC